MALFKRDFDYICKFAKEMAAIVIEPDREYFVEARVEPLARSEGFHSIGDLVEGLRMQSDLSRLHLQVLDALTINETLFFRDVHPFEALRTHVLPELLSRAGSRPLNIWSAASSTGQEAYSIAMLLKEYSPAMGPGKVAIYATDLTERVLDQARQGSYSQFEVNRGLPASLLIRYFRQEGNNRWILRDDIRSMVRFERMNLSAPWPQLPLFDLILVRNVMIYFDVACKREVLEKASRQLQPGGYVILGSAETTLGICSELQPHQIGRATVYRRERSA
jgi:chemotaxis protein methyltransferase CheR